MIESIPTVTLNGAKKRKGISAVRSGRLVVILVTTWYL